MILSEQPLDMSSKHEATTSYSEQLVSNSGARRFSAAGMHDHMIGRSAAASSSGHTIPSISTTAANTFPSHDQIINFHQSHTHNNNNNSCHSSTSGEQHSPALSSNGNNSSGNEDEPCTSGGTEPMSSPSDGGDRSPNDSLEVSPPPLTRLLPKTKTISDPKDFFAKLYGPDDRKTSISSASQVREIAAAQVLVQPQLRYGLLQPLIPARATAVAH